MQGTKRALLIGINQYANFPNNQLHGCVNDVMEMYRFLAERVHFSGASMRVLAAPTEGNAILPEGLNAASITTPTGAAIREAFAALISDTQEGDVVLVYYSGHGVRVSNRDTNEWTHALVPTDSAATIEGFSNLVTDRELNAFIRQLVSQKATVTVILDSCHSGATTRALTDGNPDPTVRKISLDPLSQEEWEAFQDAHNVAMNDAPSTNSGSTRRGLDSSGWIGAIGRDKDWIALSGCRSSEESHETPTENPQHGVLTQALLQALRTVAADQIQTLKWRDLFPGVRQNVLSLRSDQTPTLEGRDERPVFGGAWTPFDPGFAVTVTPQGLRVDGGTMQGLEPGAQIAIYPPGTPSFTAYQESGRQPVIAQIEEANATDSLAVLATPNLVVEDGSRAKLFKPSSRTARLQVVLTDVPEPIATGLRSVDQALDFLELNPAIPSSGVEIRKWDGPSPPWPGYSGGWVMIPYGSTLVEPTPDDVIAYLPPLDLPAVDEDQNGLGIALGKGLVHWAKYVSVWKRANTDDTLQRMNVLHVKLRKGSDYDAMKARPADGNVSQVQTPNASGMYELTSKDYIWIEVRVSAGNQLANGLFIGVVLCSNDGNIQLIWPPPGGQAEIGGRVLSDEMLGPNQTKFIGKDAFTPGMLTVREDQEVSLYTLKVFAYTGPGQDSPINLRSLEQPQMVQDVIGFGGFGGQSRGGYQQRLAEPLPTLWTTIDLPLRVRKTT